MTDTLPEVAAEKYFVAEIGKEELPPPVIVPEPSEIQNAKSPSVKKPRREPIVNVESSPPKPADPLPPKTHHSSVYDISKKRWLCCGTLKQDTKGCQPGQPRYHPGGLKEAFGSPSTSSRKTQSWMCCGKIRGLYWGSNEGCMPGFYPLAVFVCVRFIYGFFFIRIFFRAFNN